MPETISQSMKAYKNRQQKTTTP